MNCEQIKDQLTAYLLGDLDPKTTAEIRSHLETCDGCRALAREIEPTLDLLRGALAATSAKAPRKLSPERKGRIGQVLATPTQKRQLWITQHHRGLAMAASVLFALGVLWGLVSGFGGGFRYRAYSVGDGRESAGPEAIQMNMAPTEDMLKEKPEAERKIRKEISNLPELTEVSAGKTIDDSSRAAALSPAPSDSVRKNELGFNAKPPTGKTYFFRSSGERAESSAKAPAASAPAGREEELTYADFDAKPASKTASPAGTGGKLGSGGGAVYRWADDDATSMGADRRQISGASSQPAKEQRKNAAEVKDRPDQVLSVNVFGYRPVDAPAPTRALGRGEAKKEVTADYGTRGRLQLEGADSSQVRSDELAIQREGSVGTTEKAKQVAEKPMTPPPAPRSVSSGERLASKSEAKPDAVAGSVLDRKAYKAATLLDLQPADASKSEIATLRFRSFLESDKQGQAAADSGIKVEPSPMDEIAMIPSPSQERGVGDGDQAGLQISGVKGPRVVNGLYEVISAGGRGKASSKDGAEKNIAENAELEGLKMGANPPASTPAQAAKEDLAADATYTKASLLSGLTNSLTMEPNTEDVAAQGEPEENLTGPRFKAAGVNPFVKTREQAFSTFSIGVDTASYTLMRNYMQKGYLPPAESVRTEEFVNFFDYAYKAPTRETFRVFVDVAPSKFGHGLHLMKIGVKGRRLGREEQRQARLTFLIDTSGSMDKPDRIGLVKKSLKMLVEKMAPQDLVAILQYDSHARLVLEFTPVSDKKTILAAIDSLQCSGSTNLEEGMMKAYELAAKNYAPGGESRVLLLSDGVANLGTMAAEDILKAVEAYRKQGIFCSVFGVGMGTYDDTMLQTLAAKGDGTYAFLDSEEEAKRVFVDDLSATLNTIAKDVKIQVEFSPWAVTMYRQLGYESRQLKKEDFRNDSVDAGEVGSGQSVTALYELVLVDRGQRSEVRGQMEQSGEIRPHDDRIATVRVRYRRTDNNEIEEIEQPLRWAEVGQSFDDADVRFRLAACAAEFAEILRGSPFADGSEFKDVADMLRPVALELNLDQQVQELLRLIGTANGMSRAPMND